MKQVYQIILCICAAFLLVYMGAVIGSSVAHRCPTIETKVKVDTLVIHDTTKVTEPLYVRQRIVDTMLVAVTDTIVRNDTTFVYLPRQQREYRSPQFRAWVSGHDPKLDSIKLYQTTKVVTKEIPVVQKLKPKWGIGVSAGVVTTIRDGQVIAAPGIEFGIHRNILSW